MKTTRLDYTKVYFGPNSQYKPVPLKSLKFVSWLNKLFIYPFFFLQWYTSIVDYNVPNKNIIEEYSLSWEDYHNILG